MNKLFGSTRWALTCASPAVSISNRANSRIVLDDYEPVVNEQVMLSGKRDMQVKGQYLNPKIIIKNSDYTEFSTKIWSLLGKTVNFTPFADNTNWNFDCVVVSVQPLFENGLFWRDYIEINLKSVGYVEMVAYLPGGQ